jgi:hypothetical protein
VCLTLSHSLILSLSHTHTHTHTRSHRSFLTLCASAVNLGLFNGIFYFLFIFNQLAGNVGAALLLDAVDAVRATQELPLSVRMCVCLSICLSVYLSVCVCVLHALASCASLSLCLFPDLSTRLSLCLSFVSVTHTLSLPPSPSVSLYIVRAH